MVEVVTEVRLCGRLRVDVAGEAREELLRGRRGRPGWRSSSAAAPHTSAAPRVSSRSGARTTASPTLQSARAAIRLSHLLLLVRSPADGVELAQRATGELHDEPRLDDFRDGLRAVRLVGAAFGAVDPAEFRALDDVRRGPRGTGPGGRALTAMTALVVALTCGRAPEASALASESFSAGAASFVRIGASAALLGSESRNRWFQPGADDQPQLQLRPEASPARLTWVRDRSVGGVLLAARRVQRDLVLPRLTTTGMSGAWWHQSTAEEKRSRALLVRGSPG